MSNYRVRVVLSCFCFTYKYPNNIELVLWLKICRALHNNKTICAQSKINILQWNKYLYQLKQHESYKLCLKSSYKKQFLCTFTKQNTICRALHFMIGQAYICSDFLSDLPLIIWIGFSKSVELSSHIK